MENLQPLVVDLVRRYKKYLEQDVFSDSPKIQVDEIAAQVAAFYERIREIIDYQESHLLRKGVIERALRRRIFLQDINGEEAADSLVREIIRSGHLPNNTIPESKISGVQAIISLTVAALSSLPRSKRKDDDEEWFLGVAACAIEEVLAPAEKEAMLGQFIFETIKDHFKITGGVVSEEDVGVLLFVAVYKSLFKVDDGRLGFRLLGFLRPGWQEAAWKDAKSFARELSILRSRIRRYLKDKRLKYFLKLCNKERAVFRIAGDLVFNSAHLENFEKAVVEAYEERYAKEKSRLYKLAFFSIISFFLSKILIAIAIEMPIDTHFSGGVSWPHVLANIIFPPVLMFLVMFSVRLPSDKNVTLLKDAVRRVVFGPIKEYTLALPKKSVFYFVVHLVYTAISLTILYYFSVLLLRYGFSAANVVVFILFTSLVTATGVKVYNRARELSVEKEKSHFGIFLLDLVTLPLVTLGKLVMSGLKRFNVLVIVFNVLIELPVQIFIEFLESFNTFIRGKKDEVE